VDHLRFCFTHLFFVSLLAGPSIAQDLACPVSLSVQQTAVNLPSDWEATSTSEPLHLDRVAFYLKHPKLGGALVPDKTDKQKDQERVTWSLVGGAGDDFWLGCLYTGTTVILAQKLKKDVSQCVVRYDLLPSGSRLRVKAISCK
jgi:hypothetical protein